MSMTGGGIESTIVGGSMRRGVELLLMRPLLQQPSHVIVTDAPGAMRQVADVRQAPVCLRVLYRVEQSHLL